MYKNNKRVRSYFNWQRVREIPGSPFLLAEVFILALRHSYFVTHKYRVNSNDRKQDFKI